MKKYALIFPGQGAQKQGMGKDLYEYSSAAKKVFDTADEVLGRSISEICFNGSEEELTETINSQPCILTVSLAAYEALKEKCDIEIKASAGHSLGEYAALYSAGVLDLKSVLQLIQKRAKLMNDAAQSSNGAMAAVLGLDNESVINLAKNMQNVYIANFNSPGQIVITGDKEEINKNIDIFKEAGAKRVIPLAVSGAFHSPYMQKAADEFVKYVNNFNFNNANWNVYTNVDAQSEVQGSIFKEKLPKQISSSVMWTQTINNIVNDGIMNFIEIGPGKVLAGLNKKINSEINTFNIYDVTSLNNIIESIKEKEGCLN